MASMCVLRTVSMRRHGRLGSTTITTFHLLWCLAPGTYNSMALLITYLAKATNNEAKNPQCLTEYSKTGNASSGLVRLRVAEPSAAKNWRLAQTKHSSMPRERRRPGVARRIPWDCNPLFSSYYIPGLLNALGTASPNAKAPSEHHADNARPCFGLRVLAHRDESKIETAW